MLCILKQIWKWLRKHDNKNKIPQQIHHFTCIYENWKAIIKSEFWLIVSLKPLFFSSAALSRFLLDTKGLISPGQFLLQLYFHVLIWFVSHQWTEHTQVVGLCVHICVYGSYISSQMLQQSLLMMIISIRLHLLNVGWPRNPLSSSICCGCSFAKAITLWVNFYLWKPRKNQ